MRRRCDGRLEDGQLIGEHVARLTKSLDRDRDENAFLDERSRDPRSVGSLAGAEYQLAGPAHSHQPHPAMPAQEPVTGLVRLARMGAEYPSGNQPLDQVVEAAVSGAARDAQLAD